MGQSKLELAVGTGQWDAGLKKAQQALNSFTNSQGGLQKALEKDNGDMQKFIQMMSKIDSTANTAKGQMNDYKRVLEQLTADYDKMTDAQKKSIGQDYLNAIDAMKQKFHQAKQQADALNRSLNEMGDNKLPDIGSGGTKLDGMLAVFGGNLMTKGASMAMSVVTDFASEINSCVKQGIELAKQGEGIRIAFERLGRGDILQGLHEATHGTVTDLELMKAAVKFNDFRLPVEELGTMLAFAQQKAKDTGQSIDYMVDSIVTGLGRKSLMILDNLGLSAAEIKEKMAETGDMTKAVGEIIRDQMKNAGDYVETAADRAAKANVDLQNKMEELGRKFAPVEEASNQLWTSMKIGILDIIGGPLARLLNDLTEAGRLKNALNDINGGDNGNETRVEKALRILREYSGGGKGLEGKKDLYNRQVAAYTEQETKAWREYNKTKSEQNAFINEVKNRGARESDADKLFEFERRLEKVKNEALAWQKIKAEYQQGAKEILKPISPKIDTSKLEQSVDALKIKLAELEAQRKKAIASGDTELSKNLLKQINQVKADIRGLDPNALKTTHTQTKQDKAAEMVATAERTYAETLQKSAIRIEAGLDSTLEGKKKELSALERLFDAYNDAYATYADPKYKTAADQTASNMKKLAEEIKTLSITWGNGASGFNSTTMAEWMRYRKSDLSKATYGSSEYANIQANIADMNTIKTVLEQSMKAGIDAAQFNLEPLWEKVFDYKNIKDDVWQKMFDVINKKRKEIGLDTINIDFTTGNLKGGKNSKEGIEKINKNYSQIVGGVSSIASGIQQMGVEMPKELQSIIGVLTGMSTIMTGIAAILTLIDAKETVQTTTSLIPFYAHGGIVPHASLGRYIGGNSYSGDNIFAGNAWVNSGELVLNRSEQGILSSALQGNAMKDISIRGALRGEDIVLVADRWGRRTGKGELAFWK